MRRRWPREERTEQEKAEIPEDMSIYGAEREKRTSEEFNRKVGGIPWHYGTNRRQKT